MLCPLDGEKPVGFTSAGIPAVEAKAAEHRAPTLGIEEQCSDDQPCAREDQNSAASTDTPFDAHAAGWEVVNGGKQRSHDAKGKQPAPIPAPYIHPDCFEDPISNEFWEDVWVACAEHNVSARSASLRVLTQWLSQTEIYRKVFHSIPDDTVTTWKQYKHFVAYHERFTKIVSFL